jgi:thiol-disulfide isomerase/thioredoxin
MATAAPLVIDPRISGDVASDVMNLNLSVGFFIIVGLIIVVLIILTSMIKCAGPCGHWIKRSECMCCQNMDINPGASRISGLMQGFRNQGHQGFSATNAIGAVSAGAMNTGGPITTQPMIIPTSNINNKRRIYLHYTQWCHFCRMMKPVWEKVKTATTGSGIEYIEVDEDLVHTPGISGYPTIIMLDEQGRRHKYIGQADFDTLRNWCVSPNPMP